MMAHVRYLTSLFCLTGVFSKFQSKGISKTNSKSRYLTSLFCGTGVFSKFQCKRISKTNAKSSYLTSLFCGTGVFSKFQSKRISNIGHFVLPFLRTNHSKGHSVLKVFFLVPFFLFLKCSFFFSSFCS